MRMILIRDSVKRAKDMRQFDHCLLIHQERGIIMLDLTCPFSILYDTAYLFNSNNLNLLFFVHPLIHLPLFSFLSLVSSCPLFSSVLPCLRHPDFPSSSLSFSSLAFYILHLCFLIRFSFSSTFHFTGLEFIAVPFLILYKITYPYNSICTLKEKILLYSSIVHSYTFSLQWMASYC